MPQKFLRPLLPGERSRSNLIQMKRCPSCQSTYTDDSLKFCLSDGTPLVAANNPQVTRSSPDPTTADMPTLALPPNQLPDYKAAFQRQQRAASAAPDDSATQQRRIMPMLVVGLVLLASAAVVALVVTRSRPKDNSSASRTTSDYPTSNSTTPQSTPSIAASPTPSATVAPSATPTPTVTPTPDSYSARAEVMSALNAWTASLNRQDLDANMRLYADNLNDFYGRGNLSKAGVRGKRRANFEMYYSSINVQLSNVSVNLDSSGTVATVLYDNTYNWQGGTKYLRGKSHNKMVMSKIGGRWLITSEQHLQTYYENSGG